MVYIEREDRPRRDQDEYRRRGNDEKNTGAGGEFVPPFFPPLLWSVQLIYAFHSDLALPEPDLPHNSNNKHTLLSLLPFMRYSLA